MEKQEDLINVCQWNCRSISTNLLQFENYLLNNNFSVLALQSLNVIPAKLPKLINFYYPPVYTTNKSTNKVQTAIYIRSNLQYSYISLSSFTPADIDVFITGVTVKFNDHFQLNILSVYYPCGPKNENTDWMKHLDTSTNKWLILGDFNAHAAFWDNNCSTVTCNRFLENIVDSKLYLLNNGNITRIPDIHTHKPSAIDLSFISPEIAVKASWETESDNLGSDHLPISIKLNEIITSNDYEAEDKIPKYIYKKADWNKFKETLLCIDSDSIVDENVDTFYTNIIDSIKGAADNSIPKRKFNIKGKRLGNSWWNEECERAVLAKKASFKKWLKNRNEENHTEMKYCKINCNRIVALAKRKYWSEYCETEISESKDMFKVWRKVKEFKTGHNLQHFPLKLDNNIFPSSLDKAEAFVTHFTQNMLSSNLNDTDKVYRENEENKSDNRHTVTEDHYINAPISYEEFHDGLLSFSNNQTAVGIDGISYQLLIHLPDTWKKLLHSFYQKCWLDGMFPLAWKQSVIVPVLKQGKSRSAVESYRPIALTSNVGKLLEKIVQTRLLHFCDKNNVIPLHQAGFRKGRSTTDHLVKLTNHVKKQFARRKNTLATFFDVKKAYDSVWHFKLLEKLKNIGISGNSYEYFKNFLSERLICTRVGTTYSSFKSIDMGIPQGSIVAPLLFTLLIHDLPKALSSNINVAQFADDIAIWLNTNIKKNSSKFVIKHIQNIYQAELNRLIAYMKENGLELSGEKTCLMLFNNGKNPDQLPKLEINGLVLNYKQTVRFLGVHFTPKLNWKFHIEYLLNNARKRLNFLKLLCVQPWSQDTKTLLHLAISLVRSKLTYGQEVYFSASPTLLKKLQSLDSRAIKISLGVPIHSSTIKTYKEACILPLDDHRKLSVSKYVVRSLSIENSVRQDIFTDANIDFPKRAKQIPYLQPIRNYTMDLFEKGNIDITSIPIMPTFSSIPKWEYLKAKFDIDYTETKKDDAHILSAEVKQHLDCHYNFHLKIFTDGSVLESTDTGSGFVIPDLEVQRSYYLGRGFSIFTAELYSIFMALTFLLDSNISLYNVLFCVDSKSVLYALGNWNCKIRSDLVYEIRTLIHYIMMRGVGICFCWVPSHCNIFYNNKADILAKLGASNDVNSIPVMSLKIAKNEINSQLEKIINKAFFSDDYKILSCPRNISRLIYKLRLNAWNTRFSQNVACACSEKLSVQHIVFNCPIVLKVYEERGINLDINSSVTHILHSPLAIEIAKAIISTPVAKLL